MYKFVDTNEVSDGALLPSEAMKINGEYIENQIEGYRTLTVSGREALSPDVYSMGTGFRDGTRLQSKRYPERIIVVQYQLIAKSNEEFREAYNKLGRILDVEDAELIFNDEQDKFFIGTPCIIGSVDPGKNAVVGEFEILCTDPFKYSVVEYVAEASDKSGVLIDYKGTYKGYPVLEADFYCEEDVTEDDTQRYLKGNGDCGYVAFFNESEQIIQLGDPDEVDGEDNVHERSQTLVNQTFFTDTSWGTTAKSLWTVNSGLALPVEVKQAGIVGMKTASYETQGASDTEATILKAISRASTPAINYTVSAKATERTANSVKVTFTITASLATDSNYFGKGYSLVGSVYIGGAWHDVTLKETSERWEGRTGHTKNLILKFSSLTESTALLTGIRFRATRPDGLGTAGKLDSTACDNMPISTYAASVAEKYYMAATSYGAGSAWHGASILRTVGADASGDVGASNFILSYAQRMSIGKGTSDTKQMGGFHVHLLTNDGTHVAGVRISKSKAGTYANLLIYINNVKVHGESIDLTYNNKYFGENGVQDSWIRKYGKNISFSIGGYRVSFDDDAVANLKVNKIMFLFEQYSVKMPLSYNGLFKAKFIKNMCDTFNDIPNKFSANDVVEADCKSGEVYLNGSSMPELGALGNDWEGFYLTPGLNQIGFAYSDWIEDEYAPKLKVRYREVFL